MPTKLAEESELVFLFIEGLTLQVKPKNDNTRPLVITILQLVIIGKEEDFICFALPLRDALPIFG